MSKQEQIKSLEEAKKKTTEESMKTAIDKKIDALKNNKIIEK
jgi:DNA repair exonuclease SbcCD nuclease subunit